MYSYSVPRVSLALDHSLLPTMLFLQCLPSCLSAPTHQGPGSLPGLCKSARTSAFTSVKCRELYLPHQVVKFR